MKEKIKSLKTWVRDNKKRAAGILIAFLLVIGAGILGMVSSVNSANRAEAENKKTEEIKTAKAETKKETEKKEEKKETEEKKEDQKEKKEETDSKEEDAAGKNETQTSGTTTQASGTASAPASGNSGGSQTVATGGQTEQADPAPSQPTAPPAAEEQVHVCSFTEPIWGEAPETVMQERSICNVCGADVTGNTVAHAKQHALAGEGGGDHSEWIQVPTGNMVPVITGYQCSCGAVQ